MMLKPKQKSWYRDRGQVFPTNKGSSRNSSQEKRQCSMAGSSQLYKKSTFPPLLDSYLPLNCQNQNRANWQKIEKSKKEHIRNNSRILSEEEKDELIKQALLEKHHLETYKNLYKIRNILYERYKTLLNEKVSKQRIQIKAFDLKQQQLKHKEQKCTLRRKLPFCKLSHDTKYMESLSQSNSYWVTGLQNELTKLGIIKNQQDYENFWKVAWEDVPGSKIKEKLPDIKARMSAAKSLLFSTPTGIKPLQQVKSFPNSRLKKEASHDNTKLEDHCTKTLLLQSVDICCPSTPTKMKMKSQQQMEQMFSKFLLSDVGKKQGEPLKSQQVACSSALHQKESDKRRKHEMHLHRLDHLYYFSLIKMALSKRLLKQNDQFSDVRKGQSVHDLMEYLFPNGHEHSRLKCNKMVIEENTIPCLIHAKQQEMHQKDSPKVLRIPKEKKMLLKQEKHVDTIEDEKSTAVGEKDIIAMPLSLEDVALYHPVIEPKQIGKYWTNYAGKNSFNHEKY
ncbi:uncharacterized protein LOC117672063 isoform X2 [Pantherophis guttatus]|uniref:Uncharacterized protein LOC117672063 isoform X2 n=1 Tax=Pantherophis guttatus TaxID=94885 RepID=A0A6P9CXA4_PANGU|nr:uncharacterized protein LOC117672063 isoform X2 [Pantherophis guttatus]